MVTADHLNVSVNKKLPNALAKHILKAPPAPRDPTRTSSLGFAPDLAPFFSLYLALAL